MGAFPLSSVCPLPSTSFSLPPILSSILRSLVRLFGSRLEMLALSGTIREIRNGKWGTTESETERASTASFYFPPDDFLLAPLFPAISKSREI